VPNISHKYISTSLFFSMYNYMCTITFIHQHNFIHALHNFFFFRFLFKRLISLHEQCFIHLIHLRLWLIFVTKFHLLDKLLFPSPPPLSQLPQIFKFLPLNSSLKLFSIDSSIFFPSPSQTSQLEVPS
jgi:hypothetical protein